jgi:hypothetical protein
MSENNGNVMELDSTELPGAFVSSPVPVTFHAIVKYFFVLFFFSDGQIANIFALLSVTALILVALRVIWLATGRWLNLESFRKLARESIFFKTRMGMYAGCILIGNLFSSIAGVIGVYWLAQRRVMAGQCKSTSEYPLTNTCL